MREKISQSLKTFKTAFIEKNRILAQKGREVKKENEYVFNIQKQSIDERNKNICVAIKSQEKEYQDKKKREEIDRKRKLKVELEKRLMEEEKKVNLYTVS